MTMAISDQERQKVVQYLHDMILRPWKKETRLRVECPLLFMGVDVDDDGFVTYYDVERLIDLVDRGTCHDVSKPGTAFECSECGMHYHADADYLCAEWECDRPPVFEYCPHCGRKVAHGDD